MNNNWNRPHKNFARKMFSDGIPYKIKKLVSLAGEDALCIKQFEIDGKLDKNCKIQIVESDSRLFQNIMLAIASIIEMPCHVVPAEQYELYHCKIEKYLLQADISDSRSVMHIDLNGGPNVGLGIALIRRSMDIQDSTILNFTFNLTTLRRFGSFHFKNNWYWLLGEQVNSDITELNFEQIYCADRSIICDYNKEINDIKWFISTFIARKLKLINSIIYKDEKHWMIGLQVMISGNSDNKILVYDKVMKVVSALKNTKP